MANKPFTVAAACVLTLAVGGFGIGAFTSVFGSDAARVDRKSFCLLLRTAADRKRSGMYEI